MPNLMRHVLAGIVTVAAAATLLAHDPVTTKVTWAREIAPIVQARCVSCHAPGGRAPMPLTTYAEARPWARAIREEVLARRMPQWPVVRGYGDFSNDPSLSPFEIALITAWVDGGAPLTLTRTAAGKAGTAAAPPLLPRPVIPDAPGRVHTLACVSQPLPSGRLVAVEPHTPAGASLRLTIRGSDGQAEPLLWVRDVAPGFTQTYRLRNPIDVGPGATLLVDGPAAADNCTVALTLSR